MLKYVVAAVLAVVFASSALAWEPPSVVKVVVGQSPGGGNEYAMRGVAPVIEKENPKVSFIIDHKPGLDNVVAMNHFAQQKPNGHTLLVVNQETGFIAAPIAYKNQLQLDPMNYTFVTTIAKAPLAFIVPIDSPFKTVPQLLAHLKNNQTKFNIGLSGSVNLLTYSYFTNKLQLSTDRIQSIRYQSPTAASIAVASKELDMAIVPISVPRPMVGSKLRILAHTGSRPIPGIEDVALMKDYVDGLEINASWSVFLPPGTPANIVKWYADQFQKALASEQTKEYFSAGWATIDTTALGPQGLTASISKLKKTWLETARQVLKNESL
jgi:tripartite-type tricarboxylate transporter receptor subunit TctC